MSESSAAIPERDHRQPSCAVPCEECDHWTETPLDPPWPTMLECDGCRRARPFDLAGHLEPDGALDGCPLCGYHTLAIQKDVNPRLGVAIVAVSFAALLFSGLSIPQMLVALVGLAILDWLLLRWIVKRLLICYRCKSQYRGFPPGPRCRPFDLATWEAHTPSADD